MRIELKPLDLERQKDIDPQVFFVELTPGYLQYRAMFTAKEPDNEYDPDLGWHSVYRDFDWRIQRGALTSIDKVYKEEHDLWKIIITISGSNTDVELFFDLQADCCAAYEVLCNYLFDPLSCQTLPL